MPNNKNKIYKTLEFWSRDMLNFDFLKRGLGIVSPPYFVNDFSRKMFFKLCSISRPNFIAWLPLLLEILVNMCICDCLLSRLWRQRFWNQPYLSNQAVFLHDQNVRTKIWISWERKELLTWNEKHFLSCLKGFQLPKAVSDLRVRL